MGIGGLVPHSHPQVVNLEKPMIITQAFVKYICENCNINYTLKFCPSPPRDMIKINNSIDKTKQCTVCARQMKIEQIIFKAIKDLYGNDMFGSWNCPVHAAFIYYPTLMRKTEKKRLFIDIISDTAKRYKKVIAGGFPWLCPGCGRRMVYKEDKLGVSYGTLG